MSSATIPSSSRPLFIAASVLAIPPAGMIIFDSFSAIFFRLRFCRVCPPVCQPDVQSRDFRRFRAVRVMRSDAIFIADMPRAAARATPMPRTALRITPSPPSWSDAFKTISRSADAAATIQYGAATRRRAATVASSRMRYVQRRVIPGFSTSMRRLDSRAASNPQTVCHSRHMRVKICLDPLMPTDRDADMLQRSVRVMLLFAHGRCLYAEEAGSAIVFRDVVVFREVMRVAQ